MSERRSGSSQRGASSTIVSARGAVTVLSVCLILSCRGSDSNRPLAPAQVGFTVPPGTGTAGAAITPPIQVAIQDVNGKTVTVATAAVTVTLTNPGSATLSGTTTVNTVNGVATFKDLSIDKAGDAYTLTALASNLTVATSASFAILGPAKLAFGIAPAGTAVGAIIAPIQVTIQDARGNTVPNATNAVTLSFGSNPAGATLSGTTTVNAVNGVATFNDIAIDKTADQYTLTASATDLTAVTSPSFSILGPSKLTFSSSPLGTVVGVAISPAIQVLVQDARGNIVPNATNPVTVSLGTNPVGGTLSGTKTVSAVRGVATFSDLSVDKASTGYTLTATSGDLTGAVSAQFTVNIGPPTLHIITTTTGTGIPTSYSVDVDDDSYGSLFYGPISANGDLTLPVSAGQHYVQLLGVPYNCTLSGESFRTVTVNGPTDVKFVVVCAATGTLTVTTTTGGSDINPDGYTVCVDRAGDPCYWHASSRANDALSIPGILSGPHTVTLNGVGGNCVVSGGATHAVTVPASASVTVPFSISCSLVERIAYSLGGTISIVHTDGTGAHSITSGAAPAWSPDGTRIAYECGLNICAINADGTGMTPIATSGASNRHPTWSPDGQRIAFSSSPDGTADLYVAPASGGGAVRLTQGVGFVGNPAWSPDGTQIAFDCQVDAGNSDICVVHADGGGFARLTSDPAADYGAAWKPDGSTLAFSTRRFDIDEIVLMSPTGGSVTRIGGGLRGYSPTWSPDGTQLGLVQLLNNPGSGAFESIAVVRSDGSNLHAVTKGVQPAWKPHR